MYGSCSDLSESRDLVSDTGVDDRCDLLLNDYSRIDSKTGSLEVPGWDDVVRVVVDGDLLHGVGYS